MAAISAGSQWVRLAMSRFLTLPSWRNAPVVRLSVPQSLCLLQGGILGAAVFGVEYPASTVVELAHGLRHHVRHAGQRLLDAHAEIGSGMVVVKREYILMPLLPPIPGRGGRHGAGGRTGIVERVRSFFRAPIQGRIVCGFVNANSPDHDRGMISIAADHVLHVAD